MSAKEAENSAPNRPTARMRPGGGFILLVLALVLFAAFSAFALRTPMLETLDRLEVELRIGRRPPLSTNELETLERALCQHPGIAADWLDGRPARIVSAHRDGVVENGYAYVIQSAQARELDLTVAVPGFHGYERITVRARTTRTGTSGSAMTDRPFRWRLRDLGPCATLVEVLLSEEWRRLEPGDDDEEAPRKKTRRTAARIELGMGQAAALGRVRERVGVGVGVGVGLGLGLGLGLGEEAGEGQR